MGIPSSSRRKPFFALGSRALDADATARVYRAKHRSTVRPLPLILGDWEQLDMIAKVHDELMPLLKRFWPGPLSVIFPARLRVPDILTGGTGRVACAYPPTRSPRACAGRRRTHHLQQREHQRQSRRRQRQSARRRADRFRSWASLMSRPFPQEACPPHSSNAWKTAGSASSGQAPSPPRRSLKPGLRLWKKNEDWRGRGSLLKKGFPFPLPQDFRLYRILHGGFSVCDKFFFGSSFLKNKNGPELFPGPLLSLSLSTGRRLPSSSLSRRPSHRLPLRKF